MNKRNEKLEKFKLEFNALMSISTIQGLPKIFLSRRDSYKFIWLILTLISTCVCSYFSVKTIIQYLEYDVTTEIQSISDKYVEFPTVTFCHQNNTNFSFEILSFKFNAKNSKEKWKEYFESYMDKRYGKCFRFNSGKDMNGKKIDILKSNVPGLDYGLKLDLYIPRNSTNYGELKVYVHNNSFIQSTLYNHGIIITSGSWNNFKLSRTYDCKLGEPYNKCHKDISKFELNKSLIEYINQKNSQYSQKECMRLCQNLKYSELYNNYCKLNSLDDYLLLICYREVKNETVKDITSQFISSFNSKGYYKQCENYCPLECDSLDLIIDHSTNSIAGDLNEDAVGFAYPEFYTYKNVSKSFISIRVYYSDLKYTFINQLPKIQFFDLLSNIGGIFGLFLGMSFLNLFELLEIVIESILISFKK